MKLKGTRALVTGGAGFIGSELVHQLADAGAEVTVLDNLVNGKRENVDDSARLEIVDVRDRNLTAPWLRRADVVFHLACLGVRHSIHSPLENHEVNATATLHLLSDCRQAGVARFVYVSSSEVYGTAQSAPMTEDHPTRPHTVYGGSKLAGESYARAYHRTYGYPTVILRPFNTYGPRCHHEGDSGEVIPKFLIRAMAGLPLTIFGEGSQTRDFTHTSDTARGILQAAVVDAAIGETINLGQGSEIRIDALARTVSEVAGAKEVRIVHDRPRPGDVLRLIADTTRARKLLDFEPRTSLHEGLRDLKNWYEVRGVDYKDLLADEVVRNWTGVEE